MLRPMSLELGVAANKEELVAARARNPYLPSWVAIFTKALALVAADNPRLRQAYLGFPTPRLYEHPHSVASIAVERDYHGEEAVFFVQFRAPERQPLAQLDASLQRYKTRPLDKVSAYREALRFSRLWRPLRRLVWWYGLNVDGRRRARRFGTFGVSVYSSLGAESLHPLGPLTTTLTYGPIAADGQVDVRLVYDHRVLDGAVVARALHKMEDVLTGPITAELAGGVPPGRSAPNRLTAAPVAEGI